MIIEVYLVMNAKNIMPPVDLELLAKRLKLLADPTRLQIIQLLLAGRQHNSAIGEALEIPPNLVSYHLRVLQEAGLIESDKESSDGRRIAYRPVEAAFELLHTILAEFFDPGRIQARWETTAGTKLSTNKGR